LIKYLVMYESGKPTINDFTTIQLFMSKL
jgi:hypothetical protein